MSEETSEQRLRRMRKTFTEFWGETKLLLVGTVLLAAYTQANIKWFVTLVWIRENYSVGTSADLQLFMLQIIFLFLGTLSLYRWINNQSNYEPKLTGGKWVALFGIALVALVAVVIVAAIMNLPAILRVLLQIFGRK